MVRSQIFFYFVLATTFANALVLSLNFYPESDSHLRNLEICNIAFTAVFFLEMTLKMLAMGPRGKIY